MSRVVLNKNNKIYTLVTVGSRYFPISITYLTKRVWHTAQYLFTIGKYYYKFCYKFN